MTEKVPSALFVDRSPAKWIPANGKASPVPSTSGGHLLNGEGLNDARTTHGKKRASAGRGLAGEKNDVFSILLDSWVHPLRTVLSQLLIVAPQVGMVVVELGQKIVQFCRVLCLHGVSHAGL